MSSHFGELFRVSTFGESHGGGVGAVIDGCPARLPLAEVDIQVELDRRRPGQSALVTPRDEKDRCRILSGVVDGLTLGTPIAVLVPNEDARSEAYSEMETAFRPSHADYTYQAKYGIRAVAGGGRAGVFTLTRNDEASLEADLLVTYQVGGSAVGGVDYATLPGTR